MDGVLVVLLLDDSLIQSTCTFEYGIPLLFFLQVHRMPNVLPWILMRKPWIFWSSQITRIFISCLCCNRCHWTWTWRWSYHWTVPVWCFFFPDRFGFCEESAMLWTLGKIFHSNSIGSPSGRNSSPKQVTIRDSVHLAFPFPIRFFWSINPSQAQYWIRVEGYCCFRPLDCLIIKQCGSCRGQIFTSNRIPHSGFLDLTNINFLVISNRLWISWKFEFLCTFQIVCVVRVQMNACFRRWWHEKNLHISKLFRVRFHGEFW